jgi:hypothetical protein
MTGTGGWMQTLFSSNFIKNYGVFVIGLKYAGRLMTGTGRLCFQKYVGLQKTMGCLCGLEI